MKFKFLGTGTSVGVPQIGCDCKVCTSTDPRDKRRRCGAYVRTDRVAVLIDTPPEMRLTCCEFGISKVDAVVLTHAHMDHVAGFDDVRRFNTINGEKVPCDPNEPGANGRDFKIIGRPLTCYAMSETAEQMHRIFPYIGMQGGANGLFRPQIGFDTSDEFQISDLKFRRLKVEHGFPCCGYLITSSSSSHPLTSSPSLAYISDCHVIPEETIAKIKGVDTLVLNCLRERQHPTHLSLERAKEYIAAIAPRKAYLIHMCHDFTHEEWLAKLAGTNIEPAYDGLEIEIS